MAGKLLKSGLWFLGVSAVLIGVSFYLLGLETTVQFFAGVTELLFGDNAPITEFTAANVDSELRFYSVFWIVFGGFLIHTANNIGEQMQRVPVLLGLFFTGGAGRLLSYFAVGTPHTLFVVLMAVEIGLPILLMGAWFGARRAD